MTIDCQFLFKQTQWGVIGKDECPAGIFYLNLNFSPPQGCKLKSATVTVTLDDEDLCVAPYRASREHPPHKQSSSIQVTNDFGPKQLAGRETLVNRTRVKQFIPEFNVLGYGGGGIGGGSVTSFQQSTRWWFDGQLIPGDRTGVYKSLRWHFIENDFEKQPSHSSRVYTAFTFVHSGKPFLMKVDIDGRLERRDKQLLSKLRFGGVGSKGGNNKAATLVDFANYSNFQRPLDEIARGLPRAMEMKNFEERPPVVSDPVTDTTFHAVSSPSSPHESQSRAPRTDSTKEDTPLEPKPLEHSSNINPHPLLQPPTDQTTPPPWEGQRAPTIQELAQAMRALSEPDHEEAPAHENSPSPSGEDTVVDSVEERAKHKEVDEHGGEERNRDQKKERGLKIQPLTQDVAPRALSDDPDPQAVARILQMPAVLGILRMLVYLMNLLGYLPPAEIAKSNPANGQSGHAGDGEGTSIEL
jgi:hypothetical protein